MSSTSKVVNFIGGVYDNPNVAGLTVRFSGVVSGTATTNAYGSFSITLTATGLGMVNAATLDCVADCNLYDPDGPVMTALNVAEYPGGYYLFTGHVDGTVFAGEQVNFTATFASMNGESTPVNSDGSFSYVGHLAAGEDGYVMATPTPDAWGNCGQVNTISVDQGN